MKLRTLTREDVTISVRIEVEELAVRGNAMASGDSAFDKEVEDEIYARLDRGDEWAWCTVWVRATYGTLGAETCLGGCSYENEADFRAGGYFDDMVGDALDALNEELQYTWDSLPKEDVLT